MAKKNDTTNLTELLLRCMGEADPMLSMLEWLCAQLMEAEVSSKLGLNKTSAATIEPAAGADILHADTAKEWAPCAADPQSQKRRPHLLLRNRSQARRGSHDAGSKGSFRTRDIAPQDG